MVLIYDFLKEINKFKEVERLVYSSANKRRESDADHAWHLSMYAWLLSSHHDKEIDLLKVIKMALVHDLVEIYAGDTNGHASMDEKLLKRKREREAADKMFSMLPEKLNFELRNLWEDYENKASSEAKYVWALDKITPYVQVMLFGTSVDKELGMEPDRQVLKEKEEKVRGTGEAVKFIFERARKEMIDNDSWFKLE